MGLLQLRDLGVDLRRRDAPVMRLPATNGPSKRIPNQLPNWVESLSARHTRSRAAFNTMDFTMRSVSTYTQPPGCV
jgi:hypothetical protein